MNEEKPKYILLEKTEALYTLIQPMLDQFPKSAKFTLRARIEDSILDIITLLVMKNYKENDDEIKKAMILLLERAKLLVEPAGAASLAAIISRRLNFKDKEVVAILSGGNIDLDNLTYILEEKFELKIKTNK